MVVLTGHGLKDPDALAGSEAPSPVVEPGDVGRWERRWRCVGEGGQGRCRRSGRFGRLHARVLSELPGCRLTALCESMEGPRAVRTRLRRRGLHTDLETMLASEDLDAVDVVTDESAHGRQALSA